LQGKQLSLSFKYLDGDHSIDELVQWLDKKLRFPMLSPEDKKAFLEKTVMGIVKDKKFSLAQLSVNRYLLADCLNAVILEILETYAKDIYFKSIKNKKITAQEFDSYPSKIALKSPLAKVFNKNLYERIDPVNGEERIFVERIDLGTLDNIHYWVRNREKIDPFYIQGWKKGKFYPDFVAVTKTGNILALEWKGEDRISNEDTAYKVEIAKEWAQLGKGKLHFFLVHKGNVEEVLLELKSL
jgi:type III restriction enzyme